MRNWTLIVFINYEVDVKKRNKNGFVKLEKIFLSQIDHTKNRYLQDFTMLYLTKESKKTKLIPNEKLKYWHFYQDLNSFLKTRCKDD